MQRQFSIAQAQQQFERLLPTIKRRARRCFRHARDRSDLVAETVALAWKGYLSCLERGVATYSAYSLANYAMRQVCAGRTVNSAGPDRSVDGRAGYKTGFRFLPAEIQRIVAISTEDMRLASGDIMSLLPSDRDNPADVAQARIDSADWVATLSPVMGATLQKILGAGPEDSNQSLAHKLGITPGRLSQRRRELVALYRRFVGE